MSIYIFTDHHETKIWKRESPWSRDVQNDLYEFACCWGWERVTWRHLTLLRHRVVISAAPLAHEISARWHRRDSHNPAIIQLPFLLQRLPPVRTQVFDHLIDTKKSHSLSARWCSSSAATTFNFSSDIFVVLRSDIHFCRCVFNHETNMFAVMSHKFQRATSIHIRRVSSSPEVDGITWQFRSRRSGRSMSVA